MHKRGTGAVEERFRSAPVSLERRPNLRVKQFVLEKVLFIKKLFFLVPLPVPGSTPPRVNGVYLYVTGPPMAACAGLRKLVVLN